jgi:hypothetical protein
MPKGEGMMSTPSPRLAGPVVRTARGESIAVFTGAAVRGDNELATGTHVVVAVTANTREVLIELDDSSATLRLTACLLAAIGSDWRPYNRRRR